MRERVLAPRANTSCSDQAKHPDQRMPDTLQRGSLTRRNHWNNSIRIPCGSDHKAEAEHTSPVTHCYRRPGSPLAEVHASSRVSTAASHAQLRLRPDKSMPCGSVDPSVYYRDRSRIPHTPLCVDTKDGIFASRSASRRAFKRPLPKALRTLPLQKNHASAVRPLPPVFLGIPSPELRPSERA